MRTLGLVWVMVILAAAQAAAGDKRLERSLRVLAPAERLEQICDYTATERIRKDGEHRPDRAVGYAISSAKVTANTLVAEGGAFRSRKQWYQLSYTCTTTPDRMKVLSFDYKIGPPIPEEKWADYGLYR
jgi:hypothetical protein